MNAVIAEVQAEFIKREMRLSVAESLTSGNLQALIGSISNSSKYYEGGVTAYSLEQKVNLLKVDEDHARDNDCVSERVATEMAIGVARLFRTDFGIATTGYAEPKNEKDPYAFIAFYDVANHFSCVEKVDGKGLTRSQMQLYVTHSAITKLHKHLFSVTR